MADLSFMKYLNGIYKLNLSASTTVHNAVIQAIYDCFVKAHDDIDAMRLELCLTTATGIWLDYWGDFFAVYRKTGESDTDYSQRIISSIIQPKSTIPAVKDNIVTFLNTQYQTEYTREDVSITEPWKELAKYSHCGQLSNTARFYSPDYYTHAIMVISIPEDVSTELIELVNSVKAAGVKVIWSILNSYEIASDFYDVNDAWASYHRWIQTQTHRNYFSGLTLSQSSKFPKLSGSQEIYRRMTTTYNWYAKVQERDTDHSATLSRIDLVALLDYYEEVEKVVTKDLEDNMIISDTGELSGSKFMSGSPENVEFVTKYQQITEETLEMLEMLDNYLRLSYDGKLSTSSGAMFQYTASTELYGKLMKQLEKFKEEHHDYYVAVQSPITNGERAMWYVARNKNWIWNTPTMTMQDFYDLWEPFDGYEEHSINSIVEFEDAYYNGFITFGDKYQPPVVIDNHRFLFTTRTIRPWLFSSPVYTNEEINLVLQRQFDYTDNWIIPEPTIEEIEALENYNYEGYSVVRETQPMIEVKTEKIT